LAAALGIGGFPFGADLSAQTAPTFTKDVAPIFYRNCTSCHRPGGLGPMSLLDYETARSRADHIREAVSAGIMPPWHADAPHGTFLNDRRLSDADKKTITGWVDAGAPSGDAKDLPPAPAYTNSWTIGTPDAVVAMPTDYEVPAQGVIEYQYFEVPTNFTEDKWVQAIEILPGAREVVHHVLVFARGPASTPPPPAPAGSPPPTPLFLRRDDQGIPDVPPGPDGKPRELGALIGTTAPGTNVLTFPAGTALRVRAGSVLTFQMHYTAKGHVMKDRTSVGMIFAKAPPDEEIRASAFVNGQFVIPAGAVDHRVQSELGFSENVRVWGLFPHTHLRGKRWEYRLVQPDGRSDVILSVPNYDFNWQTYYMFATPLAIQGGARIEAAAWYDNSVMNSSNPDPKKDVRWGDQTWEEMQYTGILYTVDRRRLGNGPRK
jgi:mono/diheme cytochrome c family protein